MKQIQFTDQEREILLKNPNIIDVKGSRVKYCPKFKEYSVKEYLKGKYPSQIFIEAGIDVNILGRKNPQKCLSKWKLLYKDGVLTQKKRGRKVNKELSLEEKLKEAEAKIAYLEAENEFLKKLEMEERGLI